ncbi:putative uncharacterized protein DDB_G0277255 [Centruroides vittatus]|uniref:putative uncharacterized protein DDB_G0277255 n=1 Tax=Centruroides vittatus TaxID=120091 RepID=UPI003510401B
MPDVVKTKIERNRDALEDRTSARLISVIQQLAYVVYIAERVFAGICLECKDINRRTDRLRRKIQECNEYSKSINAKTVPVPVGDLTGTRLDRHFRTVYPEERNFFAPPSRSEHIRTLYRGADSIPGHFRKLEDGFGAGSSLLADEAKDDTKQDGKKKGKDIYNKRSRDVGSHRQKQISSLDCPSSLVPIDVSGSNFQKMSAFRRSLIHFDFLIKRKKKRKNKRNIIIINQENNVIGDNEKPSLNLELNTECNSCNGKNEEQSNKTVKSNQEIKKVKTSTELSSSKMASSNLTNKLGTRKGRSFLPISTLSAAMTVAVKLRETSTTKSAEHSTNEDLDAETTNGICLRHFKNSSKSSLGRDSVSSETQTDRSQDGTLTGYTSDDSAATATLTSQKRSITSKNSSCGTDNSNNNLDTLTSGNDSNYYKNYSRDQTISESGDSLKSFHTGWTINRTSSESNSLNSFGSTKTYGSCSSLDTIGNNSINSLLSQSATEISSDSTSLFGITKLPPLPPLRVSSIKREQSEEYNQKSSNIYDTPQDIHKNAQDDKPNRNYENYYLSPIVNNYQNGLSDSFHKVVSDYKPSLSSFLSNKKVMNADRTEKNCEHRKNNINNYASEDATNQIIQHKVPLYEENSKVPLKYVHHVTVTPIVRSNQNKTLIGGSIGHSDLKTRNYGNFRSLNFPKSKLYPKGRIIFSSNSLGRRRDGHPMNYLSSTSCAPEHKFATLPFRHSTSPMSSYGAYVKLNPDGKVNYCNTVPRIRHVSQNHSNSIISNANNNSIYQENKSKDINDNNSDYSHSQLIVKTSLANHALQASNFHQINYTNKNSLLNSDKNRSMSPENLFAVIHSSKKRHNIKTDTDISPSNNLIPKKGGYVKTGCHNSENTIINRTNQMNEPTSVQNSMHNGILNPSKSTSIQKFKMLLLQTNNNLQTGRHKSAVEQLKTLPWYHKPSEYSSTISSLDCATPMFQNQMTHVSSTMPFRRNSRMRASLPNHHICPPIWEDHLEESEIVNCKKYLNCLQSELSHNRTEEGKKNPWIPPHSASAWV